MYLQYSLTPSETNMESDKNIPEKRVIIQNRLENH